MYLIWHAVDPNRRRWSLLSLWCCVRAPEEGAENVTKPNGCEWKRGLD